MGSELSRYEQDKLNEEQNELNAKGSDCHLIIGIVIGFLFAFVLYKDNFTIKNMEKMWCNARKDTLCGGNGSLCDCNDKDRSSCKEKFGGRKCGNGIGDRIPPYYAMNRTALRNSCDKCNNYKHADYTQYALPHKKNKENFVSDGTYDEEYIPPPGAIDVNLYRGEMGYGRNYGPPVLP